VTVRRGANPTITVLDWRGRPARQVYVVVRADLRTVLFQRRADTGGTVRPGPLDPEAAYRLEIRVYDPGTPCLPKTIEDWSPRDTEVRLERAWSVTGVVRSASGQGVTGLWLGYRMAGTRDWGWVRTKEDGRFELHWLPRGTVELKPVPGNRSWQDPDLPVFDVDGGARDVELRVP
jgi:hypothetical protein